jgi:hypothetical protein
MFNVLCDVVRLDCASHTATIDEEWPIAEPVTDAGFSVCLSYGRRSPSTAPFGPHRSPGTPAEPHLSLFLHPILTDNRQTTLLHLSENFNSRWHYPTAIAAFATGRVFDACGGPAASRVG